MILTDISRGKLPTRPQLYIPKLYCACARDIDAWLQKAGSTTPVKLCKQMYCFQSSMPGHAQRSLQIHQRTQHVAALTCFQSEWTLLCKHSPFEGYRIRYGHKMCSQTYSNFDGDAAKCGTNKSYWDKIIGKQMRFNTTCYLD